ncbi:MmcQ/YjbR family DNA-binding protein [Bowmanella dokdonensis]|uniref:MmcQ/YjbR family DNA-binding protein n=1 Tax=Bowmanella dokdonensis TaxID=751969 RepID=A0A939DME5_9ALTE|nr:MmcQ/YjbR family DNA-binding protein [Bowmanella dokdonensis]MBN7825275.1 MmcQ/YjbR family DNA-binding protein [Bowmanella dokdonensis]
MTYKEFNRFCGKFTASTYIVQWGGAHVWKVGGKVFAIGGWEKIDNPAFTFKASDLNFNILKDEPGYRPAPYMASRGMKWIQRWGELEVKDDELKYYIKESYLLVCSGLSKQKQKELGLGED